MIRRPPRSTLDRSSAASDVYKRQGLTVIAIDNIRLIKALKRQIEEFYVDVKVEVLSLSLIHISEPTRPY